MKKSHIILLIAIMLTSGCATPVTTLKNPQGNVATCGGDMSSSASLGLLGYYLQEQIDKECVENYKKHGYKRVD